jgi:hypothetical protein
VSITRAGSALAFVAAGGFGFTGGLGTDTLTVSSTATLSGRARFNGNFLDTTGAPVTGAVTTTASIAVSGVGTRAHIVYFRVTPASYNGNYDVKVYADNNTTSELLAQWTTQAGDMLDRVPWYFLNARGDEKLYVQITKSSNTGVADTFSVSLRAERYA